MTPDWTALLACVFWLTLPSWTLGLVVLRIALDDALWATWDELIRLWRAP